MNAFREVPNHPSMFTKDLEGLTIARGMAKHAWDFPQLHMDRCKVAKALKELSKGLRPEVKAPRKRACRTTQPPTPFAL